MKKSKWVTLTVKMLLCLAPGAALFGTSCGAEMRASAISAGADFVGTSLGQVLEAAFPVSNWLPSSSS